MSALPSDKFYLPTTVSIVALLLALPLWREFHEQGQPMWNGFLGGLLIALVIGAFLGVRHLQRNRVDVGEARFTSKGKN